MPHDRFFILGDLLSNILCGLAAAVLACWIIDSGWLMLPAMIIGMLMGMAITMMLAALIFMRAFGAMEVMVPTMLTGMLSGMWIGMRSAMAPLPLVDAICYGTLIGVTTLALCWAANAQLRGKPADG